MSSRRRRGAGHAEEEHVDERWLVSYADMITVLMCLFIVLFAMSSVDQQKFQDLKASLATGFGAEESENADVASGVLVPPAVAAGEEDTLTDAQLAEIEVSSLEEIRNRIQEGLSGQGLESSVAFTIDERGLTVRLVGSDTFFESNSTGLSEKARRVLDTVGPVIAGTPNDVSVEGHADRRDSVAPFATNWELSSGRATGVLRYLVEAEGVAGERISAIGFGSARPITEGTTDADLALNRRVDIVVHSDEKESVRGLIPAELAGATDEAASTDAGSTDTDDAQPADTEADHSADTAETVATEH